MTSLTEIRPRLDASALAARFVPPARFDSVRFDNYRPDPSFASQTAARDALANFSRPGVRRSLFRRPVPGRNGRYLDGGFGVGKTHLLASLWHGFDGAKAYLTFSELTAYIGFTGMPAAITAFSDKRLVCIDEFELDDVANTLMVVTFLRAIVEDTKIAVTSNTLPSQLGERRFSASEFRREIAAISEHFDELRIDGADFRTTHTPPQLVVRGDAPTCLDDYETLVAHLRTIHPVQYGALLDSVGAVSITGLHTIDDQDEALLFVAFLDKLYDARIPVTTSGCSANELFAPRYRNGGYAKKYGRAESRLTALDSESK